MGHPYNCGPPCRYIQRKGGCRDGAKCPNCHLCMWNRSIQSQLNSCASSEAGFSAAGSNYNFAGGAGSGRMLMNQYRLSQQMQDPPEYLSRLREVEEDEEEENAAEGRDCLWRLLLSNNPSFYHDYNCNLQLSARAA